MIRTLKVICIVMTVVSIIIHLLTFIPSVNITMGKVFYMHIITLILFFATVVSLVRILGADKFHLVKIKDRFVILQCILKAIPLYALLLGAVSMIYAFGNFFNFFCLMEGGNPVVSEGVYYLNNHGHKIRDLTVTEYNRFLTFEVRGFSGHWIVFNVMSTIFFFNRESIAKAIRRLHSV